MALIKPEFTEGDREMTREEKRKEKEEYQKQTAQ